MREVVYVGESLQGLLKGMSEKQQAYVSEMFHFYMGEYKELRVSNDAESVSEAIHKAIDDSLKETASDSEDKISCRKGCSFCCYQRVDISEDEATLITAYSKEIGLEIPYDRLSRQEEAKSYTDLPFQEKRCAFLNDEDSCSIYDHRPSACRKLLVVSEPSLCDVEKNPNGRIKKLVSLEAEVIASSSLNARPSGRMSKMLLAKKPKL